MYIANRAFGGLRKFSTINKHRQIFNLAFKMNKLKTKYKNVAQSKSESLSLSIALLAIYEPLSIHLTSSATLRYQNSPTSLQSHLNRSHPFH
jgi:hypothetical protein